MKHKILGFLLFLALANPCLLWAGGQSQRADDGEAASTDPDESVLDGTGGQEDVYLEFPDGDARQGQAESSIRQEYNPRSMLPESAARQDQGDRWRIGFPVQVVTRPLLEMVYLAHNDIKDLPYYLSESISLEYSQTTQNLEISRDGEITLRDVTVHDRIYIEKGTAGILTAISYDADGRMLLAINFDETDDAHPLIFREDRADRSFHLVHYLLNDRKRKIYYGRVLYDLQTSDIVPRLQIRFREIEEFRPSLKTLPGRHAPLLPADREL